MGRKWKITVAIPAYNAEKTLAESIRSAIAQEHPMKEVLILDDGSTDKTAEIAQKFADSHFGVRVIKNEKNMGIGRGLERLMDEALGMYIVYLCADDVFTNSMVLSDICKIFDNHSKIGVIGRYFYQYMDGHAGPINVTRDKNILTSSCCPSGMAFRKMDNIISTNNIFIECPAIVAHYLKTWEWTMMEWDTVAARIHPGGNTGTKTEYYKGSMYENWASILGEGLNFPEGLIQVKNRAPKNLFREIRAALKTRPENWKSPAFWTYAAVAVIIPGFILKPLSKFYRHRINRQTCSIIERPAPPSTS